MRIADSGGALPPQQWTPDNQATVNADINQAMTANHGNVEKAFIELRNERQQPQNYYDSNLAIAADYLRARWDTQSHGSIAETANVDAYLALKKEGIAPKEGPGPLSPYSNLEAEYMHKGIQDQANAEPFLNALWNTPVPVGPLPVPVGVFKDIYDNIRSWLPF